MALFGGEKQTKEEKQEEQLRKFIDKYGMDSIDPRDLGIVKKIANDLYGNVFMKAGMALSFAKVEEQAKVTYLSALVEQNWLIINQLSRLNVAIEKLEKK